MKTFKIKSFLILLAISLNIEAAELNVCQNLAEKYGKQFKIPNKLLSSISIVESGRVRDNNYVSWPWTLNVDGQAKYFRTKKEALNFLMSNFNKSKNIDVGCMQISTKYHSQEFINISDIIDPEKNVEYAAKYLRQLYNTHKTWNEAVARYHSSVPARKKTYLSKVHYFWKKLRQNSTKKQTKQQKKLDYFKTQLKQEFEIL